MKRLRGDDVDLNHLDKVSDENLTNENATGFSRLVTPSLLPVVIMKVNPIIATGFSRLIAPFTKTHPLPDHVGITFTDDTLHDINRRAIHR
jgi:hypothetical protein